MFVFVLYADIIVKNIKKEESYLRILLTRIFLGAAEEREQQKKYYFFEKSIDKGNNPWYNIQANEAERTPFSPRRNASLVDMMISLFYLWVLRGVLCRGRRSLRTIFLL